MCIRDSFVSFSDINPPNDLVRYLKDSNVYLNIDQFQVYNDAPVYGHLLVYVGY